MQRILILQNTKSIIKMKNHKEHYPKSLQTTCGKICKSILKSVNKILAEQMKHNYEIFN